MKVLIISGFLGAGKTTFIKTLVQRTKRDFVVLENEYGGSNVDKKILEEDSDSAKKMDIWELTEGCVCCSMKESFASSILTIANTLNPDYLIVEPTGLAKLGNIISNIRQIEYEKITLLSPLLIIDSKNFEKYIKEYGDIFEDQIKNAGTILFSKTEQLNLQERNSLFNMAKAKNNTANIVVKHYSNENDEWFKGLLQSYIDEKQPLEYTKEDSEIMDSITLFGICLQNPEQLILFLNGVTAGTFGNITRAKGYLLAGDICLRFDVVGREYSITGCDQIKKAETTAVFIGKDLKKTWLRQVLHPVYQKRLNPQRTLKGFINIKQI